MMKTESFNWQRPAKICNGVKDFGLLREKLTNPDESKRRDFSSIYISRLVFIVGVIAIITFVMCLVLADKYQKSVSLSHHYASFVFEKGQDERLYAVRSGSGSGRGDDDDRDRKGGAVHKSVFNAAGFVKLENISNKLPIEEINLLLPATTVLHSLNASRNGRKYSSPPSSHQNSARWTSETADTIVAKTVTAVKKKNNIQSLADLLRRTELKTVVADRSGGGSAYANATTTTTTTAPAPASNHATATRTTAAIETAYGARGSGGTVSTTSTQTSIHFAQLESYPRRTRNNNLQNLIKYINCESSTDCWLKQQQQDAERETSVATAASDDPRQTQTYATLPPQHDDVGVDAGDAKDSDSDGYGHSDSNRDVNDDEKQRMQVQKTEQRSPWSSDEDDVNSIAYANKNNYDDDDDDDQDQKDDTMFTADTRAAPRYYSPPSPSPPYLTMNRNHVYSDPFRNFRASSPVEINRLLLHDQTESASVTASEHQMLQHRFSNRMYHNQGGSDSLEAYAYDLDPYLKPPTPPPPTLLSFTPSYATTTIFHPFNDPSLMAGAAPPAHFENDLRSEATAVEPILSQIKPISLMVEIFPANEYELPGSVLGTGSGTGSGTTATSNDNHMAAAAQQREQTLENGGGGATSNQANAPSLAASLMSWKLAPFSQNKMRLLVNLFPQHQHTPASG